MMFDEGGIVGSVEWYVGVDCCASYLKFTCDKFGLLLKVQNDIFRLWCGMCSFGCHDWNKLAD